MARKKSKVTESFVANSMKSAEGFIKMNKVKPEMIIVIWSVEY